MLHKIITYTDYNGDERKEEFLFNLNKAEVLELELGIDGGLKNYIERIVEKKNVPELAALFKKIVLLAYGEKSADGKRFIKSDELRTEFEQSEAYSELIMEILSDEKAAADFMNGVVPKIENKDKPNISVTK